MRVPWIRKNYFENILSVKIWYFLFWRYYVYNSYSGVTITTRYFIKTKQITLDYSSEVQCRVPWTRFQNGNTQKRLHFFLRHNIVSKIIMLPKVATIFSKQSVSRMFLKVVNIFFLYETFCRMILPKKVCFFHKMIEKLSSF